MHAQSCLTLWPQGLYLATLLCALNFPGKNTGVGCHLLLQGIFPILSKKLTHWKRPWCWERLKAGVEGDDRDEMDEMVGWHHWFNGHEFVQAPGDFEGQGSLECCSPWGHKESDTTEWLNNEQLQGIFPIQRSNLFSCVSCTGRQILYHWASQKAPKEAR